MIFIIPWSRFSLSIVLLNWSGFFLLFLIFLFLFFLDYLFETSIFIIWFVFFFFLIDMEKREKRDFNLNMKACLHFFLFSSRHSCNIFSLYHSLINSKKQHYAAHRKKLAFLFFFIFMHKILKKNKMENFSIHNFHFIVKTCH